MSTQSLSRKIPEKMRAIICPRYGLPDVLRLKEVERPIPRDDEVLVRVQAASVNRSDWEGLTGTPLYARMGGLLGPRHKILGSDIAGRVEMVGRNVERFQPGDEVFGDISGRLGGFAEYVCAREGGLALKPAQHDVRGSSRPSHKRQSSPCRGFAIKDR